jgi:hypothetical protein
MMDDRQPDFGGQPPKQQPDSTGASDEASTRREGSSADTTDRKEYLVVLDYTDEAERKRIEYLLKNREDTAVSPLRGFVRLAETDDLNGLYEDLSAKVNDIGDLSLYQLEDVDTTPSETRLDFEVTTDVDEERIEWLFESLMNKRDAAPADIDKGMYVMSTRKGTARCWYTITDNPDGTSTVTVNAAGYGEAPGAARKFLQDEMEGFL